MTVDYDKLIEFLEPRIDAELLEFIRRRLAAPEHESLQSAYGVLVRALDAADHESALENQFFTMQALQYGSTLSPEQEEQLLRRLLQ